MTTLNAKFKEAKKASNNEHYSTISVRTPIETASMVDTVSITTQQAVMNMFTTDLSDYLASYLLQNIENKELIEQVLQEQYQQHKEELADMVEGSSIEILESKKAIKIQGYIKFALKLDNI
ncbi:hypothetical protein [Psychrobacter sanguinis]|uniref:Uncharacterized protein n=1 Tax=Psychrobacter sanguinis TaxID=861445 RepID=A0A844M0U3_9GAMM|nr:hypothetical protein [Psychrobacter sanguinis]MUG32562.1 hypothetical protein [Psychrobacter sanguinis]